MNIQDFFYLSLGIGIWIIVLINAFIAYKIIITLRFVRENMRTYSEVKNDARMIGNVAKAGFLTILSGLLAKVIKGGDNND